MEHAGDNFNKLFAVWLHGIGFELILREDTGFQYVSRKSDTVLIIDTGICDLPNLPYVAYTSRQNLLMNMHHRVFRFLFDPLVPTESFKEEIEMFLSGDSDPEKIHRWGGDRSEYEPDPTLPEATFEDGFLDAFDDKARMALHREFAYYDFGGTRRYIDYALFSHTAKFAIELNGEHYHNPVIIGSKRYKSQLFKQNSLVADGFKVFRWSLEGMADKERFILELKRFFGKSSSFLEKKIIRVSRPVKTFSLHEHQYNALERMEEARKDGQQTFLLVLPTGTGKTEIFIEDMVRIKKRTGKLKALIIVPSRKLRDQTISRLKLRVPSSIQGCITTDVLLNPPADFCVQTTAYIHRHYYQLDATRFDYIVIDEAHHAAASGLRTILKHFSPIHLLGVTATPNRFDRQSLEEIFGEYESPLSLAEAIEKSLVPPVRCYRISSNIDLTEVRFNGREYVKNDLQKTLLVPSRDRLIADILNRYFSGSLANKQGVIFCVDIKHAKRMSDLLNVHGIKAMSVDGKDRSKALKAQKAYDAGSIRFLCACDLLTEGWDAPQTSILVMARPTFSKVLYVQQLGRGLRHYPGKEALYVIDVVDNYGAKLQPMSLHALFQISSYQPFADLLAPETNHTEFEIQVLDGLYEGERRVEPVNIFSFEELYGSFLNEEQLARELFVSTDTVKNWIRKGKIHSDVQYPFGRKQLHFFDPRQVEALQNKLGLPEHNTQTRIKDFYDFLEKRDYTFSYKIVFLLSFFQVCNERYEALLPDILEIYQRFYQRILKQNGKNERPKCPYNNMDFLKDTSTLQQNLLKNPFEKFERKRFFYHCKDLNYIAMDPVLIKHLNNSDGRNKITKQMIQDLKKYYSKQEIILTESDYNFGKMKIQSYFVPNPDTDQRFKRFLPFYPLNIAAGEFMDSDVVENPDVWFSVEGIINRRVLTKSMFVAKITGKSMEPDIPDGSYCLFTFDVGGTRNGKIVLARKSMGFDPDTGASFTVKMYSSKKSETSDGSWRHHTITLKPLNREYENIVLSSEDIEAFKVVAFFLEVLSLNEIS